MPNVSITSNSEKLMRTNLSLKPVSDKTAPTVASFDFANAIRCMDFSHPCHAAAILDMTYVL